MSANTLAIEEIGCTEKAVAPFSADIDRVLCDLNSSFNPLHKDFMLDYQVSGARDGYVLLTIAMPEGMTRVFMTMLESLAGFFRFVDLKAKTASAQCKALHPFERQKAERLQSEFKDLVCSVFDEFIEQGRNRKDAVKLTNQALKTQKHPWATYEVVLGVIRATGRLRRNGGESRKI